MHFDWLIFDNSLCIPSAGFLESIIYNCKQCRQVILPLSFVFLPCEESSHRLESWSDFVMLLYFKFCNDYWLKVASVASLNICKTAACRGTFQKRIVNFKDLTLCKGSVNFKKILKSKDAWRIFETRIVLNFLIHCIVIVFVLFSEEPIFVSAICVCKCRHYAEL